MQVKYILKTLTALILGGFLLVSCEKAQSVEPDSDDYLLPGEQCNLQVNILGDSVHRAGNNLEITAEAINSRGVPGFVWYWPNGDSSKGANLVIDELSPEHSGTYIVQASNPKQCYAQSSIDLRVLPAAVTCDPLSNSMEIENENDLEFTSTYRYIHNVNENLVVQASNDDYTLEVQFRGDSAIEGKVYHISDVNFFEQLGFNQVFAKYSDKAGNTFHTMARGKAFISYIDGKLSVTLCGARFSDGTMSKGVEANITAD